MRQTLHVYMYVYTYVYNYACVFLLQNAFDFMPEKIGCMQNADEK